MDNNGVPPHEIVVSNDPKEIQQCYDIVSQIWFRCGPFFLPLNIDHQRIAVFHLEQGFPLEVELDEFVYLTITRTSQILNVAD